MQVADDIEYFDFEEDFIEENVRCIPMIVRFKMDNAGIKLKLSEWSQFNIDERTALAQRSCSNEREVKEYRNYLSGLILKYTSNDATALKVELHPAWAILENIHETLQQKAGEFGWKISLEQWKSLSDLQRFALLKLCRPGHENRNFPKAMKEFGLA